MHLSAYMNDKSLSDEDVAAAIGKHRVSVSRYRRGVERPSSDVIGKIFAWSDGKVTPNDWFESVEAAE
jgi:transcriptional regulator with XRE-family HTH domain